MNLLRGALGLSEIEKPPYATLKTWENENVELRHYEAVPWVCTDMVDTSMDSISRTCFGKLFKYIRGSNNQNSSISMTSPVTIESKIDPTNAIKRCFTMGFYVPKAFHGNTPSPTEDSVYIENRPAMKVYCRTYSGFSTDAKMCEEARLLGASLTELGLKYESEPFFFAGYDPPFKLFNRRNEIWFKALD